MARGDFSFCAHCYHWGACNHTAVVCRMADRVEAGEMIPEAEIERFKKELDAERARKREVEDDGC